MVLYFKPKIANVVISIWRCFNFEWNPSSLSRETHLPKNSNPASCAKRSTLGRVEVLVNMFDKMAFILYCRVCSAVFSSVNARILWVTTWSTWKSNIRRHTSFVTVTEDNVKLTIKEHVHYKYMYNNSCVSMDIHGIIMRVFQWISMDMLPCRCTVKCHIRIMDIT